MSRSIHSTYREYGREMRHRYAQDELRSARLDAIGERIRTKRRIKQAVRGERSPQVPADLPPVPPEAIPIEVLDAGDRIHYPASADDLRGVMRRLPPGVIDGIAAIELGLGIEFNEESLSAADRATADRDPWFGRAGYEILPGVHCGTLLGSYQPRRANVRLFAYVYEPDMPDRALWELFLKLQMLATFVHEVAHHDDHKRRIRRGRWRADDTRKVEAFAESTAGDWIRGCVVPYLHDTYPEAVAGFQAWLLAHGGTTVPLHLVSCGCIWDDRGRAHSLGMFTADEALYSLARSVRQGEDPTSTRLEFARELHYGCYYSEALDAIATVLRDEPANLEALTLQADIRVHQEDYAGAEEVARRVVREDSDQADAWRVLADIYGIQQDWPRLLLAAEQGLAASAGNEHDHGHFLLERARANLELERFADIAADLVRLAPVPSLEREVAKLRALLLLRIGQYEEALSLAMSRTAGRRPTFIAVFLAVRFEAARKLGRAADGGELSVEVLDSLRYKHSHWVERLTAEYGL